MTQTIKCFVAHSNKNKDYAHNLEHSVPTVDFFTISDVDLLQEESLAGAINLLKQPGFILISDNFLKSTACMYNILSLFDDMEQRDKYAFVIVDGIDNAGRPYPTELEDINHVIQYMNYWQIKYDQLRNEIQKEGDDVSIEKTAKLVKLQNIAGSTGEFLRILRKNGLIKYKDLLADEQALLFQHLDHSTSSTETENPPKFEIPTENSIESVVLESEKLFSEAKSSNPIIQKLIHIEAEQKKAEEKEQADALKVRSVLEKLKSIDEPIEDEAVADESLGKFPFSTPDDLDTHSIKNSKLDLFVLAEKLIKNKDYSQAVRVLNTFIKHHADHDKLPEARLKLAQLYVKKINQFEKATDQLEILISKGDFVVDAYKLLAEIAELNHDQLSSKSFYEKLIQLEPDNEKIHYKLGLLCLNTQPVDVNECIKHLKNAIHFNPKNVDAHYQLGKLYLSLGKHKKALKQFTTAMNLNPHHPFIAYEKAVTYREMGDIEMAIQYYHLACETNPDYLEAEYAKLFTDDWVIPEGNLLKKIGAQGRITASPSTYYDKRQYEMPSPKKVLKSRIDKTVLITGATSGIGKATAEKFAKAGFRVIITGRRSDRLTDLEEHLTQKYDTPIQIMNFDVRNRESVMNFFDELDEAWRKVDILINNAGLALGLGPIHEGDLDQWETMIDTNLKGLLYMIRAVAPSMVRRKSGHIINVASIAGKEIYPNGNVYIATKHAVDALTKAARIDLSPYNIRVSQVAPGHVEATEFAKVRFSGDEEKAKIYEDFNPITSDDVADAIFYIATRAPHVNIQDLLIMGTQQANATTIHRTGRIFDEED